MDKIEKITKALGYLDYAASISCVCYGAYTQNWWYGAFGLMGLLVAYLNPAKHAKTFILKRFMQRPLASCPIPGAALSAFVGLKLASYQPRSRYPKYAYFVGFGAIRIRAINPRDLSSVHSSLTSRFSAGIRPLAIVLKKRN